MNIALTAPGLPVEGVLAMRGGQYRVRAIYDLEGAGPSADPSGFRIDGAGGVAGAVDVLGGGRAWLSRSLDRQRTDVICVFAGLLLYRPPDSGAPPANH